MSTEDRLRAMMAYMGWGGEPTWDRVPGGWRLGNGTIRGPWLHMVPPDDPMEALEQVEAFYADGFAELRRRQNDEPSAKPEPLPPWFRWLPGMLAERWTGPCHGSYRYTDEDIRSEVVWQRGTPVLTDPATLGCLVGLLREVSGDVEAYTSPQWVPAGWVAWWGLSTGDARHKAGPTEGEALWFALDAAWANRGGA